MRTRDDDATIIDADFFICFHFLMLFIPCRRYAAYALSYVCVFLPLPLFMMFDA